MVTFVRAVVAFAHRCHLLWNLENQRTFYCLVTLIVDPLLIIAQIARHDGKFQYPNLTVGFNFQYFFIKENIYIYEREIESQNLF